MQNKNGPDLDIRSTPEQPGIKLILGEEKPKEPPFRSVLRLANDWASLRAANYRRRTAQLWFHSLLFAGNSRTWFEPGFNFSSVFSRPRPRLFSIALGRPSRWSLWPQADDDHSLAARGS